MNETNNHNGSRWTILAIALVAVVIIGVLVMRRPAEEAAEAVPPSTSTAGLVPFLMEQQWLIRLRLALAEEAEMAPQIRAVGRVVPVPSKRAIVAPPVSGIIQSGTMPRVGQQVARGQSLATLVQTPSAAEAAQIRIETMRVDAERRRLVQAQIEAEARLEEATHDAGRARRLYEKKAYSQKALEVDELDEKAKEAQLAAIRGAVESTPGTPSFGVDLRNTCSDCWNRRECQQVQPVNRLRREKRSSKLSPSTPYGSKRLSLKKISDRSIVVLKSDLRRRHFPTRNSRAG